LSLLVCRASGLIHAWSGGERSRSPAVQNAPAQISAVPSISVRIAQPGKLGAVRCSVAVHRAPFGHSINQFLDAGISEVLDLDVLPQGSIGVPWATPSRRTKAKLRPDRVCTEDPSEASFAVLGREIIRDAQL